MSTTRKLLAVAIVAGSCTVAARAEVSAATDYFGNYLRTVVTSNSSVKALRIWSVGRVRPTHWPLNPSGDANGDLWPYVAENPVQGRWPWVVWSRFNGGNYDLAWSRWTGRGWSPIANVEEFPGAADELDPALAFDREGRAHAVWISRTADGGAQVNFSMFLATRWMVPICISEPGEEGLDPSIVVLPDFRIEISYETADGRVTRTLTFGRPSTITDDITPFGTMTLTEPRRSSGSIRR